MIDWKTSDRRKNTLKAAYDDPVQIAAYMGALNADSNYPFEVNSEYTLRFSFALIIHLHVTDAGERCCIGGRLSNRTTC